jgi:hypothetical protein
MTEEKQLSLRESSQLTIDIKSLMGILAIILSIAGVYFSLTSQIAQLQLDVIRMQDAVEINSEFRILWPRGELAHYLMTQSKISILNTCKKNWRRCKKSLMTT